MGNMACEQYKPSRNLNVFLTSAFGQVCVNLVRHALQTGREAVKTIALLSILVTIFVAAPAAKAQNDATNRSKGICPWPGNLDGVKAAPENHKVIFENEHVRVLEVTIPPHSKEPVHTHCLPSTLYIQQIGDIIVRDPDGKLIFDSRQMKENEKQKAPFVLWNSGEGPHSDENPDDVPIKTERFQVFRRMEIGERPVCPRIFHLHSCATSAFPAGA